MFIAAVNRVGREESNEGFMDFYGRSFISDHWGKVITQSETKESEVIAAELDMDEIKKARNILQFHRDRRVDMYGDILKMVIRD
jgi:N-carbamoylputrescine amidase